MGWAGLFLPAGAPREVIDKLSAHLRAVLQEPAVRQQLLDMGVLPNPMTQQRAATYVRAEAAKWRDVAATAKGKVEE